MAENIPIFVYSKYLGQASGGLYGDPRGFALFTVRSVPGEIIGGSTIIGRLRGKRYWSYEGEFSTNFQEWHREKLAELASIEFYEDEIARFKPEVWHVGGMLYGIIAYDEPSAVTAAYQAGFQPWPQEEDKNSRPWVAFQEYYRNQKHIVRGFG